MRYGSISGQVFLVSFDISDNSCRLFCEVRCSLKMGLLYSLLFFTDKTLPGFLQFSEMKQQNKQYIISPPSTGATPRPVASFGRDLMSSCSLIRHQQRVIERDPTAQTLQLTRGPAPPHEDPEVTSGGSRQSMIVSHCRPGRAWPWLSPSPYGPRPDGLCTPAVATSFLPGDLGLFPVLSFTWRQYRLRFGTLVSKPVPRRPVLGTPSGGTQTHPGTGTRAHAVTACSYGSRVSVDTCWCTRHRHTHTHTVTAGQLHDQGHSFITGTSI